MANKWFILFLLIGSSCQESKVQEFSVSLKKNQEDKRSNGTPYTPTTQSFYRGHHWLEGTSSLNISLKDNEKLTIELQNPNKENRYSLENIDTSDLLPYLSYPHDKKLDDFDKLNLRLAEYSRNGIGLAYASKSNFPHFFSQKDADKAWTVVNDFEFKPNPNRRPLRMEITNNCLDPGLWEIAAKDNAGEMFHGWFDFPKGKYYQMVAKLNNISANDVQQSVRWNEESAPIDLNRLRNSIKEFPTSPLMPQKGAITYSTQDSRRKINKSFNKILKDGKAESPKNTFDIISFRNRFNQFKSPGIYGKNDFVLYDFSFLKNPISSDWKRVSPKTRYENQQESKSKYHYFEVTLNFDQHKIVIGNLPFEEISQSEDYEIPGFGVGILKSSELIERRKLRYQTNPHPYFAYLVKDGQALNSHAYGIEQIFIRSYPNETDPHLKITLSSYERIIDIAHFKATIPKDLIQDFQRANKNFYSPIYRTYRDDNIR